jgi:hypothetical protein
VINQQDDTMKHFSGEFTKDTLRKKTQRANNFINKFFINRKNNNSIRVFHEFFFWINSIF